MIPSDRWIASLLIVCALGLAWIALIDDSPSTGVAAAIIACMAIAYLPRRKL